MVSTLPNPDTYLNHFNPDQAKEFEAFRNVTLAVLGATIWDILIYIPEDVAFLRRRPLHLVTFSFVSSRVFAFAFVLLSVLQHTGPVDDCKTRGISIGITCILAMSTTSFLFLQRARAVYSHSRWIPTAFTLLWLASSGVMTTTAFGVRLEPVPGTKYCVYTIIQQYMSAAGFVWFLFDGSVFAAVSYKIATSHSNREDGITWDTIVSGKALPGLSRAVLQGGQQYFLLTIFFNLPVGLLIALPGLPPNYRLIMGFPAVAFSASMACRVVRNMSARDLRGETRLENEFSDVDFATFSWFQKTGANSTTLPSRQGVDDTTAPQPTVFSPFPETVVGSERLNDTRPRTLEP